MPERHASWLELFFDLVFVVAIAQLAQGLVRDHGPGGFATFAGLFLVVFIAWQGFTFYADRFDTDDLVFRTVMLAGMLAMAALAATVPDVASGRRDAGFVLAYVTLRVLVIGLYGRSWRSKPVARPLISRYVAGYGFSVVLWCASLALPAPWRYGLWGVGLAVEYAMPVLAQRFHALVPVDREHVPERFALFTVIVLGESVVAVSLGTADTDWRVASVAVAGLGFAFVAGLWWLYFDRGIPSGLDSLTGSMQRYVRVHIPLLAALTAVGAGVHLLIEDAAHAELESGAAWALSGGGALFLLCLTVAQRAAGKRAWAGLPAARALAGGALLGLAALAGVLSPALFMACACAAMLGLAAREGAASARDGADPE